MGLGLLSMPYAMRLSGWLGLAAMAALTCLFCMSGKLIVQAFDKMPLHCAQTYPALGQCTQSTFCFAAFWPFQSSLGTVLLAQGSLLWESQASIWWLALLCQNSLVGAA